MTAPNLFLAICFLMASRSVQGISNSGNEYYLMYSVDKNTRNDQPLFFVTTDDSRPVQFNASYNIPSINCTLIARKGELTKIVMQPILTLMESFYFKLSVKLKAEEEKNIIVYGLNEDGTSTIVYLALPYFETTTEIYDYYGVSSHRSNLNYMAVVIQKDNTYLTIIPTVRLKGDVPGATQMKIPGRSYRSTACNRGQVFFITSTEDLTGSKISSNNPITFITGVQCGDDPPKMVACNYLTQQLPPAETFGFMFFLVPPRLHQQAAYKLVASVHGTGVTILCVNKSGDIVQWDSFELNDGQFRHINVSSNYYCSIEANHPLLAVQFAHGHSFNGPGTIDSHSFMTMVQPRGQYRNNYTFLFAESSSVNNSKLNSSVFKSQFSLCVPVGCYNSSQILFDDQPLPDDVIYVPVKCKNGDVCAYCAQCEVPDTQSHGVHTLKHSNPKCTLGVIVSGYGKDNSYAYPAGMNLDSIAAVPNYCFKDDVISTCNSSGSLEIPLRFVNTGKVLGGCIHFSTRDESDSVIQDDRCCFDDCGKEVECYYLLNKENIIEGCKTAYINLHADGEQQLCKATLPLMIIDCADSSALISSHSIHCQPKVDLQVNVDGGCDPCYKQGQVRDSVKLTCRIEQNCQPSNCTIRNPDGITAQELDDFPNITMGENYLTISEYILNNPVNFPASPTLRGVWTCTCIHKEGNSSASNIVSVCSVVPKIDKGLPQQFPIVSTSGGSHTFKIGGSEYILAGYNFTIQCKVLKGVPEPKIIWLKDDIAIEGTANLTHFTVPVSRDDPAAAVGRYTCRAINAVGVDEAHSQMQLGTEILVPPIIWRTSLLIKTPRIVQSESDVEVSIGTDVHIVVNGNLPTLVTLNCSLCHQALPNAQFTWTKNDQPINDTQMIKIKHVNETGSLLIINVTDYTDEAQYCCKAASTVARDTVCAEIVYIRYSSTLEDQYATTVISSLIIVSFILVTGIMVGIPVLVKCLNRRKKRERKTKHEGSGNLILPSRVIYQGGAASEEIYILAADEWEISPDDLELQEKLGKGQFGDVKLALVKNMSCTSKLRNYVDRQVAGGESLSTSRAVAVKYLRDTTTNEKTNLFLQEIALMIKVSEIGNNHVVQLLGCIVAKTPMAMIMEFCPFGDLHSNLVQWRKEIGAYVKPNFKTDPDSISLVSDMDCQYAQEELKEGDLFSFAHQIAIGMRYLASMNVIHRDLACRNVLVGENKILKISDFGLSKEIDGVYASTSNTKLPLRWMSPEAIRQRLFSEKSDVWSYGVCLWEICTLGKIPYEDKTNAEVATAVAESLLLDKPYKCHDEIYKMMLDCWKMDASARPTFKDIEKHFEQLIMNECSDLYIAIHNILEVPDKTNSHVDPVCQTEGKEPGKFPEQGVH